MKTTVEQPTQPNEYREWFNKEVELGLADIEAGRVVSHDEVREHILKRRLIRARFIG